MAELEWLEVIATVLALLGSLILILKNASAGFRKHIELLFDRDFKKVDDQLNEVRVGNASVAAKLEEAIGYHKVISDKIDCVQNSTDRIEDILADHEHKMHLIQIWAKSMYHALTNENDQLRAHLPDPDDYFKQPKP
jgi:hypothetical protein